MVKALAMMAHPDDAEILVGGTLLILRSIGWELGIVSMTAGDCGSATHSKEEIMALRLGEAESAAQFLGARYACAGMRDAEVFANSESLRRVAELMRSFAPDVVITHSPVDYMLDHEETSRLVRAAAFAVAMPLYETRSPSPAKPALSTPALYYADPVEGVDPMGVRLYPQFYVDISDRIEDKRRLVGLHKSQRDWLRKHHGVDEYLDRMSAWAEQYGAECGVRFAEGLRQHRGHGYPQEPLLQTAAAAFIRKQE